MNLFAEADRSTGRLARIRHWSKVAVAALSTLAGISGALAADAANADYARRSYPATVAKRRIEAPPAPRPSAEDVANQARYKIAGGKVAAVGQFPWQVALVRAGSDDLFGGYFCGGSLIAERFVLTAAHCTLEDNPDGGDGLPMAAKSISVVLGTHNFTDGVVRNVKRIERHEFDHKSLDNDIAILELDDSPAAPESVKPVPLIETGAAVYKTNVDVRVIGWGATVAGPIPIELRKAVTDLQYVDMKIKDQHACNDRYVQDRRARIYNAELRRGRSQDDALAVRDAKAPLTLAIISDNMFCAGGTRDAAEDACEGDSGGPLLVTQLDANGTPIKVQAGIVSWGPIDGCGLIDRFGVYVRLANYRDWINGKIQP